MLKTTLHIVILESSKIIFEGLYSILYQSDIYCRVYRAENIDELSDILKTEKINIIIANPVHFVNRDKEINKIKKEFPSLSIVGIDFGVMHKAVIETDASFTLYDTPEHILHLISRMDNRNKSISGNSDDSDNLTKRELEVLTCIVNGKLNKEIAEELNISIHTVVRHRKNITTKTGIRSQSGLTIYAISKKIVEIEDIEI
ncbi:MAG: LuxR C-terminal-related transcriptional regulator [Fermentimonas sp.]|nr:LuxR C-terminal-related transcriptional regulator [Fermentimonas sp.]